MKKRWIITSLVVAVIAIGAIAAGPIMSNVETPSYTVVKLYGNVEIRQYDPMVIAEVRVNGERKDAIGEGFRLLADYIFGNNVSKDDIAMTAPVQQQKSKKIAMTAPVQQQSSDGYWRISFVMPSNYSIKTLPKPTNDLIALKVVPSKQFIAIIFAGPNSDKNLKRHEQELRKFSEANSISISDNPKYAFYNPPWTLPALRRNEILFELKQN